MDSKYHSNRSPIQGTKMCRYPSRVSHPLDLPSSSNATTTVTMVSISLSQWLMTTRHQNGQSTTETTSKNNNHLSPSPIWHLILIRISLFLRFFPFMYELPNTLIFIVYRICSTKEVCLQSYNGSLFCGNIVCHTKIFATQGHQCWSSFSKV